MALAAHDLSTLLSDLRRTRTLVTPEELAHRLPPALATGLPPLDRLLGGGLPLGRIVELAEARGALGTSLALHLAARATQSGRLVALVDRADAFDPRTAAAAGVRLERLLWCRPASHEEAIRAADALLVSNAFGLVILDFGAAAPRRRPAPAPVPPARAAAEEEGPVLVRTPPVQVGGVPEAPLRAGRRRGGDAAPATGAWLRLSRDAESARASLLVLGGAGAGTFAAASLRPLRAKARFAGAGPGRTFEGLSLTLALERNKLGLPPGEATIELRAPELFPAELRDPPPGSSRVVSPVPDGRAARAQRAQEGR